MADVIVKKVEKRSDLRKFIAFPNKLFKDVPSYIPALDFDEINLLTDKNPSLEHWTRDNYGPIWIPKKGESIDLTLENLPIYERPIKVYEGNDLVVRDGKIVGRVAAIINRSINEHWNKKAVRFGWFDFIEDYDVFTALLDR